MFVFWCVSVKHKNFFLLVCALVSCCVCVCYVYTSLTYSMCALCAEQKTLKIIIVVTLFFYFINNCRRSLSCAVLWMDNSQMYEWIVICVCLCMYVSDVVRLLYYNIILFFRKNSLFSMLDLVGLSARLVTEVKTFLWHSSWELETAVCLLCTYCAA